MDAPCRLDAVHHRHDHIHQHQVRHLFVDQRNRLLAVAGMPDNFEVVEGVGDGGDPLVHLDMVVYYDQPYAHNFNLTVVP